MRSSHHGLFWLAAGVALLAARPLSASVFTCAGGDTACLINSINAANAAGWVSIINLGAGTYHLTSANNSQSHGPNGLPLITSVITIQGAGASATIIQRDSGAPPFRMVEISSTGRLVLNAVTLQGNGNVDNFSRNFTYGGLGILNFGISDLVDAVVRDFSGDLSGAGVQNVGSLSLLRTLVEGNSTHDGEGAGILNTGTMQINRSTIRNNLGSGATSGGGISTGPNPATITASNITGNAVIGNGGGIVSGGGLTIKNSTIQQNHMDSTDRGGGGIYAYAGTTILESCTIADNSAGYVGTGGGVFTDSGATVQMRNTILARNTMGTGDDPPFVPQDCFGPITSLGHNIVGNTAGCTINLQATDHLGDPKLGTFTDQIRAADGSLQGNGQIPLLAGSPAIDGGDYNACSTTDQLGYPRVDANLDCGQTCDIGAVEYAPVVDPWISLTGTKTTRGKALKGYPAGTVTVTLQYTNNVLPIGYPVFVLTSLSSNAVLLNGDPPNTGGVGSRMTSNAGGDWIWSAGETVTVTWIFGLKSGSTATFTADAVGFPDYP